VRPLCGPSPWNRAKARRPVASKFLCWNVLRGARDRNRPTDTVIFSPDIRPPKKQGTGQPPADPSAQYDIHKEQPSLLRLIQFSKNLAAPGADAPRSRGLTSELHGWCGPAVTSSCFYGWAEMIFYAYTSCQWPIDMR